MFTNHLSDPGSFRSLVSRARQDGAEQISILHYDWPVAGRCQNPIPGVFTGIIDGELHERRDFRPGRSQDNPMGQVDTEVRCRKCPECLNQRRILWTERALRETEFSWRTWFGTLTVRPQQRYIYKLRTIAALRDRAVDYDTLTEGEQFKYTCQAIGKDLTLMIKRLRKSQGGAGGLRYFFVFERHKDGFPHLHCLLHEQGPDFEVRKLSLHANWPHGFSSWKIVSEHGEFDRKAVTYVAKYLSKSADARVRASLKYGAPGAGGTL